MKTCPFCTSAIPDAAIKCQFCAEFVEKEPKSAMGRLGEALQSLSGLARSLALAASVLSVGAIAVFYKYSDTEVRDVSTNVDEWYISYINSGNTHSQIGRINVEPIRDVVLESATKNRSYTPFGQLKEATALYVPPSDPRLLAVTLPADMAAQVTPGMTCALSFEFPRPCPGNGAESFQPPEPQLSTTQR